MILFDAPYISFIDNGNIYIPLNEEYEIDNISVSGAEYTFEDNELTIYHITGDVVITIETHKKEVPQEELEVKEEAQVVEEVCPHCGKNPCECEQAPEEPEALRTRLFAFSLL